MEAFTGNTWFKSLPEADAQQLLASAQPRQLAKGEFLLHQGDAYGSASSAFFGIAEGLVKLSVFHPDGNEAVLTLMEAGNWLGEVSLLTQRAQAHNVIAVADSTVLVVTAERFDALMEHPAFARSIARLESERLRLAYGLMADSTLPSTGQRVARRLVLLAHGDVTLANSERDSITTSQDTLAMMLGISRPTLSKELGTLARLGAVALRYGRIEVKDMALLIECAGKSAKA